MFTILGGLIGFLTSLLPEILRFLKDSKDKKHEIDIIKLNIEAMRSGDYARLEEINSRADIEASRYIYSYYGQPINVTWVDVLAASVRPVLTYTFFLLYAAIKLANVLIFGSFTDIWQEEDQIIFGAVIGFWFGARSFEKARRGRMIKRYNDSMLPPPEYDGNGNHNNGVGHNGNGGTNGSSITNGNGAYYLYRNSSRTD